jgi:predicted nucleic acid-binding protein
MTPVVVDASAFAAIAFQEPGYDRVVPRLDGKAVYAPHLLAFELANVAWKKARRYPAKASVIVQALAIAFDDTSNLIWHPVHPAEAALLARAAGVTAYDASYLWLAGFLGADLVTLDDRLAAAARRIADE